MLSAMLLSMSSQMILAESVGESIETNEIIELSNLQEIYNLSGQGAIVNPTGYINGMSGQTDRGDGQITNDDAWTMTNHPVDQSVESHYSRDSEGNLYFLHHQNLRHTKSLTNPGKPSQDWWLTRAGILDVVPSIFDVNAGKTYLRKMTTGTIGFANYQYELPERYCVDQMGREVWPFDQHPLGDLVGVYHSPDDMLFVILGYTYRISNVDAISLDSAELDGISCTLESNDINSTLNMTNSMVVLSFANDDKFLDLVINEGLESQVFRGAAQFALDTQLTSFFPIETKARDSSPVKLIFSENGTFSLPIIEYGGNCINEAQNNSLCYYLAEFSQEGIFESMTPIFDTPSRFVSHFRPTFDSSKLCYFAIYDEDGIGAAAYYNHTSGEMEPPDIGNYLSIYNNPNYEVGMIDIATMKIDWNYQNLNLGKFNERVNLDCSNQFATLHVTTNEEIINSDSLFNDTFNGSSHYGERLHSILLKLDDEGVRVLDPLEWIDNFVSESLHQSNITSSTYRYFIGGGFSHRVDGDGVIHLFYSAIDRLTNASVMPHLIEVWSFGYLKYDMHSDSILYHESAEIEDGTSIYPSNTLIASISKDGSVIVQYIIDGFDNSNITFFGEFAPINPIMPTIGLYHENMLTDSQSRGETWFIEFEDSDNDGIRDKQDPCPNSPQTWPDFDSTDRDRDGCHDETQDDDDDDDGIFDWDDNCPQGEIGWMSGLDSDADEDGCQDATEDEDTDGDGILDSDDECQDEPNSWQWSTQFDSDRNGCVDDDWAWWIIQEVPEIDEPTSSEEPISGSTPLEDKPTTLAKLKQTISTPAGMAGIGAVSLVAIAGVSIAYASGHQPLQHRIGRRASLLAPGLIGGIKHSREPAGVKQREKALELIEENPGIHYSELRRLLNWGGGQLAHHLSVLERDEDIWRHPSGKLLLIFPSSVSPSDLSPTFLELLTNLSQKDRDILALLWQDELRQLTQHEIANWFVLSEATVSRHLRKMESWGLVSIDPAGRSNNPSITELGIEFITLGN